MRRILFSLLLLLAAGPAAAKPKVVVVAVDGAGFNALDSLIAQGRLPRIARWLSSGWTAEMDTGPLFSPAKWTLLYSGRNLEDHGVSDFRIDGEPMSSWHCRVARVWDVLGAKGFRVGVFRPLATTPVYRVNGAMLADRWRPLANPLPGGFSDAALGERLGALVREHAEKTRAAEPGTAPSFAPEAYSFVSWKKIDDAEKDPARKARLLKTLTDRARVGERAVNDLILELDRADPFDFLVTFIQNIDMVSHVYWKESVEQAANGLRVDPDSPVGRYYVLVDEVVGRLVDAFPPDTWFLLISDHGFADELKLEEGSAASGKHSDYGIFCLNGPGVAARREKEILNGLDVAPTLLALFGLPPSREMPGKPLIQRDLPERVKTYKRPHIPKSKPEKFSKEEWLRLRELNYLR